MRLILVGMACSGKDFAREQLLKKGYVSSISYTTRDPRPSEIEGKHYHYVSEKKFKDLIDENFFYEHNFFADRWYYGTPKASFGDKRFNLFIMTPSGVRALSEKHRQESIVVFINPPEEVRRKRLLERKDADNAERRLATDRVDFDGFDDYDLEVGDAKFDVNFMVANVKILWYGLPTWPER